LQKDFLSAENKKFHSFIYINFYPRWIFPSPFILLLGASFWQAPFLLYLHPRAHIILLRIAHEDRHRPMRVTSL
jgi:hypothetical protein